MNPIERLHHAAYRCQDSEATRQFYEDFVGLPLVDAFEIKLTQSARPTRVLHSFYAMADDACIAFFEEPSKPFEFKAQRDFDLHIAVQVNRETLIDRFEQGPKLGIETRGITDHGFIESAYFRDPNGYVVELTTPKGPVPFDRDKARSALGRWQASKPNTELEQ